MAKDKEKFMVYFEVAIVFEKYFLVYFVQQDEDVPSSSEKGSHRVDIHFKKHIKNKQSYSLFFLNYFSFTKDDSKYHGDNK